MFGIKTAPKPFFPDDKVRALPKGATLTQFDDVTGRTISLTFNRGAYVGVCGRGLKKEILICCDGDDINEVISLLLTGSAE